MFWKAFPMIKDDFSNLNFSRFCTIDTVFWVKRLTQADGTFWDAFLTGLRTTFPIWLFSRFYTIYSTFFVRVLQRSDFCFNFPPFGGGTWISKCAAQGKVTQDELWWLWLWIVYVMIIINILSLPFRFRPLVSLWSRLLHNKGCVWPHSYCFIPVLVCE